MWTRGLLIYNWSEGEEVLMTFNVKGWAPGYNCCRVSRYIGKGRASGIGVNLRDFPVFIAFAGIYDTYNYAGGWIDAAVTDNDSADSAKIAGFLPPVGVWRKG